MVMKRLRAQASASVCIVLLLCSWLALSCAPAQAAGVKDSADHGLVCPVTKLPIASPAVAVGKSVYKGRTYYFCTANCKRLFDKNPAKYVKGR